MSSPRTPRDDDYIDLVQVQKLIENVGGDSVQNRNQAIAAAVQPLASTAALTLVANAIPQFSSQTPSPESKAGASGSMGLVPHADHQHPRLTSSTSGQTVTDGTATVTFTRTFTALPGVVLMAIENTSSAGPSMKVMKWLTKNAQGQLVDRSTTQGSTETYDGCVVYAWRSRALPAQTTINVLSLLTGVITALNNLLTALSGYEPYAAAPNVSFTCIAVQSSAT